MVNYNKLFIKLKEKNINTTDIRRQHIISESTLQKMRVSSGETIEEAKENLIRYMADHPSFKPDVSFKTIEDLCQILQCQPLDLIEWEVELNPENEYTKDGNYGGNIRKPESIEKSINNRKKD